MTGGKKMSASVAFSEDQIGEFQEAFMLFDTLGDGMIPVRYYFIRESECFLGKITRVKSPCGLFR